MHAGRCHRASKPSATSRETTGEDIRMAAVSAALAAPGKVRVVDVLGPEFDKYEGDALWENPKLGSSPTLVRAHRARDRRALGVGRPRFSAWATRRTRAFP